MPWGRCFGRTALPNHPRCLRLCRNRSQWLRSLCGEMATDRLSLQGISQMPARTGSVIPLIGMIIVPNIVTPVVRPCETFRPCVWRYSARFSSGESFRPERARSRLRDVCTYIGVNTSVQIAVLLHSSGSRVAMGWAPRLWWASSKTFSTTQVSVAAGQATQGHRSSSNNRAPLPVLPARGRSGDGLANVRIVLKIERSSVGLARRASG
jgi:hypothetical protein